MQKLRGQASLLSSLKYFSPSHMSLSSTHPLFSTCGSSPYEVSKAVVQARYLSGRAKVEALTMHWDLANKDGFCLLCRDVDPMLGTLEHVLLDGGCPALADARLSMFSFFNSYLVPRPYLFPIFRKCWENSEFLKMQLLLDCSVIPSVIQLCQDSPDPILHDLFYLTRTYVFKLHTVRRRILDNL